MELGFRAEERETDYDSQGEVGESERQNGRILHKVSQEQGLKKSPLLKVRPADTYGPFNSHLGGIISCPSIHPAVRLCMLRLSQTLALVLARGTSQDELGWGRLEPAGGGRRMCQVEDTARPRPRGRENTGPRQAKRRKAGRGAELPACVRKSREARKGGTNRGCTGDRQRVLGRMRKPWRERGWGARSATWTQGISRLASVDLSVFRPCSQCQNFPPAFKARAFPGQGVWTARGLASPCPPPRLLEPLHPQDPLAAFPRGGGTWNGTTWK